MKFLKDTTGKVYEVIDEKEFFEKHPDLFARPLSDEESKQYAARGVLTKKRIPMRVQLALGYVTEALCELRDAWDEAESNDEELDLNQLVVDYPLGRSIDDMAAEMTDWTEENISEEASATCIDEFGHMLEEGLK
jgi:hypothetical protein